MGVQQTESQKTHMIFRVRALQRGVGNVTAFDQIGESDQLAQLEVYKRQVRTLKKENVFV